MLRQGGAIDWCLLQVDQEDALVLEFLEQVALGFVRRLTSEQDTADVPEEVVMLTHVDEIGRCKSLSLSHGEEGFRDMTTPFPRILTGPGGGRR